MAPVGRNRRVRDPDFVEVVHRDPLQPVGEGQSERGLPRAAGSGELEQHLARVTARKGFLDWIVEPPACGIDLGADPQGSPGHVCRRPAADSHNEPGFRAISAARQPEATFHTFHRWHTGTCFRACKTCTTRPDQTQKEHS